MWHLLKEVIFWAVYVDPVKYLQAPKTDKSHYVLELLDNIFTLKVKLKKTS